MQTISVKDVVSMIPDGASLMIGGFMGVGTPERLIDELVRQGKRNLTVIANDTARPGRGIGKLVTAGLIVSTIASHIGLNPETQQQLIAGNNPARPGRGIGKLVPAGLIVSTTASHIGLNPETQQQMIAGNMAVDLVPQGTLIERIRAGDHQIGRAHV